MQRSSVPMYSRAAAFGVVSVATIVIVGLMVTFALVAF
jgi:hypothetical protein